jgi:two-component system LytT family response regulator
MYRTIRALIVDDEISAINTLRGMLSMYCQQINVVGEAASVPEALDAAAALKPDLVFLDIEMPPSGSGFDFLKKAASVDFGVIFTTAYSQYAVQAINATQPWFYLVKPYSVSSLQKAVQIAEERLRDRQMLAEAQLSDSQGLTVTDTRKRTSVLRFRDILYCEADGSTSDIVVQQRRDRLEKHTVYRTLRELEAELPDASFCRTHHSFIVNMAHIKHYERTGRNGVIFLDNGEEVNISVDRMKYFVQKFEAFLLK